ncbi:TetR/AcrR family transcriptional regulator [Streptomyces spinoverrucosus]|uniref:TetR/AcrR family transcriptional regulator n=1 Tax=Streptomyces spinoverrucosus TaxID=284043 RepID=UPI0018C377E1|nr:TetR/AcrR family transcriptional regulator [Streptomyces spinoverrucosus]MBG0855777.1 TetR/AcrR family transcriptional regulator [Streptomyces spinoverrucosus]
MSKERRPSIREEQKRLTRERLLDAAVEVFAERSALDANMDDIAKAAGVARATVYAHFTNKSDVVLALAQRQYELADEVYTELAAIENWTRAAIHTWLEALEVRWREQATSIRALTMAGPTLASDGAAEAHERFIAKLADDRERWRDVSPAEARQRVLMALGQIESFFSAWVVADWKPALEDPLDLVTDVVCHLLAPALYEEPG